MAPSKRNRGGKGKQGVGGGGKGEGSTNDLLKTNEGMKNNKRTRKGSTSSSAIVLVTETNIKEQDQGVGQRSVSASAPPPRESLSGSGGLLMELRSADFVKWRSVSNESVKLNRTLGVCVDQQARLIKSLEDLLRQKDKECTDLQIENRQMKTRFRIEWKKAVEERCKAAHDSAFTKDSLVDQGFEQTDSAVKKEEDLKVVQILLADRVKNVEEIDRLRKTIETFQNRERQQRQRRQTEQEALQRQRSSDPSQVPYIKQEQIDDSESDHDDFLEVLSEYNGGKKVIGSEDMHVGMGERTEENQNGYAEGPVAKDNHFENGNLDQMDVKVKEEPIEIDTETEYKIIDRSSTPWFTEKKEELSDTEQEVRDLFDSTKEEDVQKTEVQEPQEGCQPHSVLSPSMSPEEEDNEEEDMTFFGS